jgi:hypothetical protein
MRQRKELECSLNSSSNESGFRIELLEGHFNIICIDPNPVFLLETHKSKCLGACFARAQCFSQEVGIHPDDPVCVIWALVFARVKVNPRT